MGEGDKGERNVKANTTMTRNDFHVNHESYCWCLRFDLIRLSLKAITHQPNGVKIMKIATNKFCKISTLKLRLVILEKIAREPATDTSDPLPSVLKLRPQNTWTCWQLPEDDFSSLAKFWAVYVPPPLWLVKTPVKPLHFNLHIVFLVPKLFLKSANCPHKHNSAVVTLTSLLYRKI